MRETGRIRVSQTRRAQQLRAARARRERPWGGREGGDPEFGDDEQRQRPSHAHRLELIGGWGTDHQQLLVAAIYAYPDT